MKLSKLDLEIASVYAGSMLETIKYGENGVFFWIPACGMTTITKDIFSNKYILSKYLQGFSKRLKIIQIWGHLADKRTVDSILNELGYANLSTLKADVEKTIEKGNEIVFVVSRIDDFSKIEKIKLLKTLVKLCVINHRRVHIIFNTNNKPIFEEILMQNPEFMILCNRMKLMPIISGNLLDKYIKEKAKEYGLSISKQVHLNIVKTYGGILQLTKEFLRAKGDLVTLELKLKGIWDTLPTSYRDYVDDSILKKTNSSQNKISKDLELFGISQLEVFKLHHSALISDPRKLLSKILTEAELALWNYCNSHSGEFLDKEIIISILRPSQSSDISMWTLDQATSRFRKKLLKVGIDPSLFKTIKGKGYKWA